MSPTSIARPHARKPIRLRLTKLSGLMAGGASLIPAMLLGCLGLSGRMTADGGRTHTNATRATIVIWVAP